MTTFSEHGAEYRRRHHFLDYVQSTEPALVDSLTKALRHVVNFSLTRGKLLRSLATASGPSPVQPQETI